MDVETALVLFGSAQLGSKLLGPTVDYLGEGVKQWTARRMNNIGSIFRKAESKLGEALEEPGTVSPRVLRCVLSEGSFCDDELLTDYFGGVLASARTPLGRDDRGVFWVSLVSQLSTYQLRSHYIFTSIARSLWMRQDYLIPEEYDPRIRKAYLAPGSPEAWLYIPYNVYERAMDLMEKEPHVSSILSHVTSGLAATDLIEGESLQYGPKSLLENSGKRLLGGESTVSIPSDGMIVSPSNRAIELFLWAHGKADFAALEFFNPEQVFSLVSPVEIPCGSGRLSDFIE